MRLFLMSLFAQHAWIEFGSGRHCRICGRQDTIEISEDEFGKTFEWVRVHRGEVAKHWMAPAAV